MDNKSKIAYVCNYLGPLSGAGQSGIDVLNAISSLGHKIYVFVPQFKFSINRRIRYKKNINWIRVPKRYYSSKNGPIFKRWLFYIIRIVFNLSCIKYFFYNKIYYNEIIINSFGGYFYYKKLKLTTLGNSFLVVRGSVGQVFHPEYGIKNKIDSDFCVSAINDAQNRIFVSRNTMNEWSSKCNFSNKPSYYIPNCVNDEQIKLVLKKIKHIVKSEYFDSQKFNIVCVASIQYMKGQDIIFNQYERLVKIIPEAKIYLIGTHKNLNDDFSNKIVNNLNSKDYSNIKYLGRRTDALDLIYSADCILLPSRGEAMPRVVLEAMALKTPVIASNVDGIPELIEDGVHGYTFDIENPKDLLKGIESVYKGDAERCVENAFNKYWENFSFDRLKRQYEKLLD